MSSFCLFSLLTFFPVTAFRIAIAAQFTGFTVGTLTLIFLCSPGFLKKKFCLALNCIDKKGLESLE
jgi:glycerol uptake facilitator-like aquaporin